MINQIKKIIMYVIIGIFILFSFTGCSLDSQDGKTINDKTKEEISYLEDEILTIINRYAKKEYNNENGINWEEIANDVQKLNNSLDTILLDLSEVKISNEDLIMFRNETNNLNIAITNNNESEMIQRCNYLYSLLPTYLDKVSDNKNDVNIMKLKSLVISSYVQANFLDWENAKSTILLAEDKYKEMIDDIDYMKEYSYNLNKVYILVEETKNAIELEELDLTRIKYINFIEKI